MRQSRPISQAGHLLGIAATGDQGWFFIAMDPRMEELHGQDFADADTVERVARSVFARSAVARPAVVLHLQGGAA